MYRLTFSTDTHGPDDLKWSHNKQCPKVVLNIVYSFSNFNIKLYSFFHQSIMLGGKIVLEWNEKSKLSPFKQVRETEHGVKENTALAYITAGLVTPKQPQYHW